MQHSDAIFPARCARRFPTEWRLSHRLRKVNPVEALGWEAKYRMRSSIPTAEMNFLLCELLSDFCRQSGHLIYGKSCR